MLTKIHIRCKMIKTNILNRKERKIHRSAHKDIDNIMSRISAEAKGAGNAKISSDDLYYLSSKYVKYCLSLNREKAFVKLAPTHSVITKFALMLTGKNPEDGSYRELIDSCTGPDRHIKSIAIMMEGHFFGSIGWNKTGNYMKRVFSSDLLKLIDNFNDIDETAVTNYCMHMEKYTESFKPESLGWALHYLQDITAPHHAGNYAVFFSKHTDGFDTHHGFEKKARLMINDSRNMERYINTARELLPVICSEFKQLTSQEFAEYIYSESAKNIDDSIRSKNPEKWVPVIEKALPLAIASTAAVLKNRI